MSTRSSAAAPCSSGLGTAAGSAQGGREGGARGGPGDLRRARRPPVGRQGPTANCAGSAADARPPSSSPKPNNKLRHWPHKAFQQGDRRRAVHGCEHSRSAPVPRLPKARSAARRTGDPARSWTSTGQQVGRRRPNVGLSWFRAHVPEAQRRRHVLRRRALPPRSRCRSDCSTGCARCSSRPSNPATKAARCTTSARRRHRRDACYCQFEAPSEAAVIEANRRVGLPFDRIVPPSPSHPPKENPHEHPTTVPTTVEITRSHLSGVVAAVAASAAAVTWAVRRRHRHHTRTSPNHHRHETGRGRCHSGRRRGRSDGRRHARPIVVADAYHGAASPSVRTAPSPSTVADSYHGVGTTVCP